jgi:hypothetical protein
MPFIKAFAGPTKVFLGATNEDISTPNVAVTFDTKGVRRVTFQPIFAGYTGVTVKAQRSVDNVTWSDVTGATTGTSGAVIDFAPDAPHTRLSITGTLSAGADDMAVWAYLDYAEVR